MGKTLRIVRFVDENNEDILGDTMFFSDLTEYKLQEKVFEIVRKFRKSGFRDWGIKDIVDELKKQNLIEDPDFNVDWCEIYL